METLIYAADVYGLATKYENNVRQILLFAWQRGDLEIGARLNAKLPFFLRRPDDASNIPSRGEP